ncbi:MAG TPA: glycosyltransferase family 4 protein [Vicinamibacterales bacterium]|nr:glycosyltransferase family 4 protein [Vicinamibacterales bacterium]
MQPDDLHVIVVSRAAAPFHEIGGLERHVEHLAAHLLRRGLRVTLVTRPPVRPLPGGHDRSDRLTVRFVPYRTFPLAGRRGTTVIDRSTAYLWFGRRAGRLAADLVRGGGVQIVHGMGAAALGYAGARLADRLETVPFVFNPHGMEEFGSAGTGFGLVKRAAYAPLRRAVRRSARAADRVIATDRALVPAVVAHLRVPEARVAVVPNAVDLDAIDRQAAAAPAEALRRSVGLPAGGVLLLGVGRLEANKGFDRLVSAVAQLSSLPSSALAKENWRLVLIGDGPARASIEQRAAASGLGGSVILPGRADEAALHAWYEAATLFVHPTRYEGSSIVTLEAMAHRRAVVASAAGGIPDKVHPGVNGWLVPPGDERALAAAIDEALTNRERLASMGSAGRAIVERSFSWQAAVDRTIELYLDVLQGHGRRPHP